MLTITVAQDGSGDFASVSEAVLAVPYACAAEIHIGPGVYREKLVCEKQDITLIGAGMESTRIVWGDGGKLPHPDGIEVARLAGLPSTVVNRAKKILRQLEEEAGRPAPAVQAQEDQVSLTALSEGEVIDQLRRAQVDTLSPLEALNLLYELKKKLN